MRKCLIITLLLPFYFSVSAQIDFRFADSTAFWNLVEVDTVPPHLYAQTRTITVAGDTVFQGHSYQHLCFNILGACFDRYLRRDSANSIFSGNPSLPEHKIYDFNGVTGDTIMGLANEQEHALSCIVDSVDSIDINGLKKRMRLRCRDIAWNTAYYPGFTWIDKIGCLDGEPFNPVAFLTPTIPALRDHVSCYFENGQLVYHNPVFTNCTYDTTILLTAINDISAPTPIQFYPNPASTSLTVNIADELLGGNFTIMDIMGKTLLQEILSAPKETYNIERLPFGIYFLMASKGAFSVSRKLVVTASNAW